MYPQDIWEAYTQSEGKNSRAYPLKVYSDQQEGANDWVHTMHDTEQKAIEKLFLQQNICNLLK